MHDRAGVSHAPCQPLLQWTLDVISDGGGVQAAGFEQAGFEDVEILRIGPKWYRGVRRHGLIMGCSVTGVKRSAGASPLELPATPAESRTELNTNVFKVALRLLLGDARGFYYFVLPIYMWSRTSLAKVWLAGGEVLI